MVGDEVWIAVCVPTQVSNEVDVKASSWQAKCFSFTKTERKPFLRRLGFVCTDVLVFCFFVFFYPGWAVLSFCHLVTHVDVS